MGNISAESVDVIDIVGSDMSLDNQDINTENENHIDEKQDLGSTYFEEENIYDIGNSESEQIISSSNSDEGYVIYVGHNNKTQTGNGTQENPFSTFQIACDEVNNQNVLYDKITLKIFEGNYTLGSILNFNAKNLDILGNGTVIIQSVFNSASIPKGSVEAESFGITSSDGNFTMTNIIFDASKRDTAYYRDDANRKCWFEPFHGLANSVAYYNCSFINYVSTSQNGYNGFTLYEYSTKFINCYFDIGHSKTKLFFNLGTGMVSFNQPGKMAPNASYLFDYCWFNMPTTHHLVSIIYLPYNISITNSWFGQNSVDKTFFGEGFYNLDGSINDTWSLPINRYVEFSVAENYLGNNQYEIVGKLTWNGTEDQDGMENFKPMTVELESEDGQYKTTATLVNGTFKTIYTSSASTHHIETKLDNDIQELDFTTVNITADPVSINYGDPQEIIFNFAQPITANITVTVSNGSYNKTEKVEVIDKNSITYTISDILKEGSYDVEISLDENNLHGLNSTTLTVSKIRDYTFEVETDDVQVGDNATISITLPPDVNGTVVIKFGNDTNELSANQTMTVNFTNLNATTYSVDVSYSGNDKYVAKDYPTAFVTVRPADSGLEIEDAVFTYGDVIAIPFSVTNANGVKVTVYTKDDDEVTTATSESGTINLDTLPAGEYSLDVETIVDSNYLVNATKINLTINKANSSLDIQDKEFVYGADAVINVVTENSTGNVIATLTDENNSEIEVTVSGDSITLPKLNVGSYTLTVTTNVDDNYNNASEVVVVSIVPAAPKMDVIVDPVGDITVNDDVTVTVTLSGDAGGLVLLEVDDVKLFDELSDGSVEFNLGTLPAKTYAISARYLGDKNYLETNNDTEKFTVSKLDTKMYVDNRVDTDGSAVVIVEFDDFVTGTVTVFNGEDELASNTVNEEDYCYIYTDELEKGDYDFNVVFTSNLYNSLNESTSFSVDFGYMDVEHDGDIKVGENLTVYIYLPADANGTVTVTVGNYTEKFSTNETLTVQVPDLKEGDYNLIVLYSGDEKYNNRTYTGYVDVYQPEMELDYNRTIGADDSAVVTLTFADNTTAGNLTTTIGNKTYSALVVDGVATLTLNNLDIGENEIELIFTSEYGDDYYFYAYIDVEKSDINSTIETDDSMISVNLPETAEGNVKFNIAGQEYTAPIKNGIATIPMPELNAGNHTVVATFDGDDKHNPSAFIGSVEIPQTDENVTVIVDGEEYSVPVVNGTAVVDTNRSDDAGNVTVVVDGVEYSVPVVNGTAVVDTNRSDDAGNVTVIVDGEKYIMPVVNGTVTVETNKTEPVVQRASEFSEITISDDQTISIVLKDEDGNVIANASVAYTVNGVANTTVTGSDGKFTIKGENGAVISIIYAGNANITGTNTTLTLNNPVVPSVVKVVSKFNISNRAVTINGYAVDGPAGEQGIYYATALLDADGKPISHAYIEFAVNNKIYNRTTNENGSFNPYKLNMIRAGRYTMAFNFAGDENYTNAFACVCVDLDKKPIKIKASAKSFKASVKTKKYTVSLSTVSSVHDGKVYLSPKKVTLKVNGKTFTGKTNGKGKVTFKITNLNKKGKYTAKISVAGDKTYEAASKSVKITIK